MPCHCGVKASGRAALQAGEGPQGMSGAVQLTSSPQQNSTEQLEVPRQSLGEPAPAELSPWQWHIKQDQEMSKYLLAQLSVRKCKHTISPSP